MPRRVRQQGFSLIEVLVTLVVLSVGIMGAVGLQFSAMRANEEALQRSRATLLAEGMLERIRANATSEGLDVYRGADLAASTSDAACDQAAATSSGVAQYDLCEWRRMLASTTSGGGVGDGLRNAHGCISINGSDVTVAIAWQSTGADMAKSACGSSAISVARRDVELTTTVLSL